MKLNKNMVFLTTLGVASALALSTTKTVSASDNLETNTSTLNLDVKDFSTQQILEEKVPLRTTIPNLGWGAPVSVSHGSIWDKFFNPRVSHKH